MNNDQFRKLVLANAQKSGDSKKDQVKDGGKATKKVGFAPTPRGAMGSKNGGYNPRNAANRNAQQQNIFKSIAPRGVKLASGYKDRTKERHDDDERAEKIKELEELLKEEKIDQETFERRRDEITAGDIAATHLVKGLDFKLLKRVKEGEDVFTGDNGDERQAASEDEDVDAELDEALSRDVEAVQREKKEKKGQLSTVAAPGQKRSRAQLLAEFKAQRAAAKAKASGVGERFKKIGAKQAPGSRIEVDSKGREVLIIVDEDGHEKRKIKKVVAAVEREREEETEVLMPDPEAKPLGMEVPEAFRREEKVGGEDEEGDVDIFDDVGSDYDPLAGLDDGESDSDSDLEDEETTEKEKKSAAKPETSTPSQPPAKINYFKDSKTGLASEKPLHGLSWSDPSIQAVLKKAATLKPIDSAVDDEEDDPLAKAREEKRRKMLQAVDRDADDMDMGFGTSRFKDEEEADESSKVRLSKWTGGKGDDDGDDGGGEGKKERKRGGTKRKGDRNSVADVMRVMEQRKGENS